MSGNFLHPSVLAISRNVFLQNRENSLYPQNSETSAYPVLVSGLKDLLHQHGKSVDYFDNKDIDVVNVLDSILPTYLHASKRRLFDLIAKDFGIYHRNLNLDTAEISVCLNELLIAVIQNPSLVDVSPEEFDEFLNIVDSCISWFNGLSNFLPNLKRIEYFVQKTGKLKWFFHEFLITKFDIALGLDLIASVVLENLQN